MKKNVIISIIMPCLNSANYIGEAIDSILKQSFSNLELIVVDSGSTDGTLDIIKKYTIGDSRVVVKHLNEKSMGVQYNIGLNLAKGEYIGFVESDDYISSDMYETLHNAITSSDVDYVKSNYSMFIDLPDQRLYGCHALGVHDVGERWASKPQRPPALLPRHVRRRPAHLRRPAMP